MSNTNGLKPVTKVAIVLVIGLLALGLGAQMIRPVFAAAPVVGFSASPSPAFPGTPVTFTATASGGTAPYSFSWNFNDTTSGTGNPATHSFTLPAPPAPHDFNVTLTVTDSSAPPFVVKVAHFITITSFSIGIDCGLGTTAGSPNPSSGSNPPVVGDHSLDASCVWAGDGDFPVGPDGAGNPPNPNPNLCPGLGCTSEPLVSDLPESFPLVVVGQPNYGGGFNAEVRLDSMDATVGGPGTINGFDVTVSFDPHLLNAVRFDQNGLVFDAAHPPPGSGGISQLASVIDNNIGTVRLAQTILGVSTGADAQLGLTLFRIRFDVVGVGISQLTIQSDQITRPSIVPHVTQSGSFDSRSFYDPAATLNWNVFWTNSAVIPGSSLTFTATAQCPGCVLPLSFRWDFDSNGVFDATGATVTIPTPPVGFSITRVILNVTDASANTVAAVRRIPLVVGSATGPATLAVGTAGSFSASWLGGLTPYSGNWRLCPGATNQLLVCTSPAPAAGATAQSSTVSETYKFAGVFTNTFTIRDTGQGGYGGAGPFVQTITTTVTGTPVAYTVTATSNVTNAVVNTGVRVSATMAYGTTYPAYSKAADTVVNGTAPASGTTGLKTDGFIRICDTIAVGGVCSAAGNKVWDPTEWVFYSSTAAVSSTSVVLYAGSGTRPAIAQALILETINHFRFLGAGISRVTGDPVIYDVNTNNAYDASFQAVFNFGDGTPTVSVNGAFTISADHVYTTTGTFSVSVQVIEFSITAPSRIGETGTLSQTVVPPVSFDYTVAWSPTSNAVTQGGSTTPNVVATLTSGTASSVSCTVSLPSPAIPGLSAAPLTFSITPAPSPGATQLVTISTTSATPAGTYTIGVSCTGGVGSHTANFALTVNAVAFDYTIAWSPTSNTVAAGASTTPNVVATLTSGATAAVTCTVSLPSPAVTGLSASPLSFSITPAAAPGATQAVTISTTVFTPGGTYTIGVSCTGGVGTHTANFSLTVTAAAFNYTVAWNPTSATVAAGSSTSPNVVATLTSGTTAAVTCTVSLPSPAVTGLSASPLSFSITPVVTPGATQAVAISTTVFTPGGTYTIGVSCTGGVGTHTANFSLTVTAAAFNYSVAWNPTSATIAAGASTTPSVIATLTSGQTASVTCTVSLPSPAVTGLSASPLSFSITPALAPGASQVVTISTTSLTPAGTYTIGVSCTGGVGTHTANFSLTVTAAGFDYTIAWSPTSATVAAGSSTSPNVVATLTSGAAASVTCTVSLPSPAVTGLSASPLSFSITPAVAPGATQAVTISTTVFTPGGTYTIGVSCTGGVGTHTANFSLTVTAAAFDYTVAWSPTSATITAGTSSTPSVVTTLTSGTAVAVTCTVSLPSPAVTGLSASPLSFSITPVVAPGASQVVTISTTVFTPGGTYTIGVSCTGGVGTHTANFSLTVTAAAFNYSVAWNPTSATITAGSSTTPNVVATLTSGAAASVTCTVSLPSPAVTGLSASPLSFSITPTLAGATQAVTISTTSLTPAGTYTIGVSCTGGVGTHTANFSLTVSAAGFDYTVAWSPTSATVAAGASTTPSVVATLTSGTAASVTCTVSLPSPAVTGLSASPLSFTITPAVAPGASQVVTISTTVFTPGGTYTIGVSCTGGVGTHTANFSLTVTAAAFDYTVAWSPTSATIAAGASTTPSVVATLTSGTAASVTCTVSLPSPAVTGLSASPLSFSITPVVAPGASQVVTISTTVFTPAGTYTIGVSCTGGVGTHTANFSLTVTAAAFNYTIAWNPTSATIAAGASTTPNVVATLTSGTAAAVTCTVSLPSPAVTGLSASPLSFSITPTIAGATQAVTISTTTLTPAGTYTIGVSCTGGVGTHTANFTLTVSAAGFDYTIAWSPTSATVAAGSSTTPNVVATLTSGAAASVTCTVSLPSPAVTGLSASPLSFSITPAVAPGATQAVAISTTVFTPAGTYTIGVSCTGGVGTHTANFSLTVTAAAFNYSVAWNPTSATIAAGASTTPSVVATLTSGQTASVTCTVSLPSPAVTGLSASPLSFSITPALAPGASQVVTISTTTLTPAGTYTIGVSCTGGVGTHTANFSLTVTAAAFDYTVAWSPTSATIAAGASTTPSVVATLTSGTAVSVTCTVSLPSPAVTGLSASPLSFTITPVVAPGASQVVTISTTTLTPAGTYTIGVSCTGGVGTHTANFSLTVTAAGFDYTVAWSPTSATVAAGSSTTPNVVATLTSGAAASVTCTVSLPSPAVTGLSASPLSFTITPAVAPGATQAVTISTTVFTPGGTYTIGVSCTGGVGTHTANFSLTVTAAAFNYSVAWNPTSATVAAGSSTTPNVVATLTSGTTAAVTCTVSLPSPAVTGLSASPLSFSITPTIAGATQAVAISTTVFTPAGTYTIGVSCTGGVGTHTANFSLTVTAAAFDYTVAWNPTSATVAAGSSTTPNVVATLTSGTAASVTCTVSLPSPAVTGLSASPLSFSITPALAPGATQAVVISTTVFTPGGTYTIGVSCTGGVGTHTANFSLTVTAAAFNYSVAWNPTSNTIAAGASTSPSVVATLTSGQTASVTCTVTLPSPAVTGLSASPLSFSITPALAPGASQVVTISTTSLTPAGTYTIGVSCTGGVGTHTANFSLTVSAAGFDYTVAWSPTSATVAAGASTTPSVVATLTSGTAASITCTVSVPAVTGLSASPLSFTITPAVSPGATQAVTISTTVFTPGGTYTIGVSCTGGVGTHTANFSLTVTAAAFDYTVAWSPTSNTITAGTSTSPSVVATLTSGTAVSVTCTVTLPSPAVTGLSASPLSFSITPAVAPGASQVVTISTTVFTPGGTYTIGVSCTGGVGTHTANFSLTVTAAAFNYSVAWNPTSATIAAGASTTPNVVATLTSGQTASVTCTVSLPSPAVTGLSASPLSFSITPTIAGATQAVTISTTTLTPAGTYTISVSCTGGVGTHTANFSLTVSAAGFDYTIAWSPTSATIVAGTSTTPNVVATLTSGSASPVTCTVSLPSPAVTGLSASPLSFSITPAVAPGATQAVAISTTTLTPAGTYTISVSCTGGVGTHTANFSLTVTAAAFDYTVAWSPTSATITAGSSTTPNVVATLTSGVAASVTCTVTLPSPAVTGLSASPLSFSITPTVAGATQAVTISTTSLTPAGTYTIGVSCTGGVGTHTANFSLTVSAAGFDYTVAWSPTSATVAAGASTTPNVVATLTSGSASPVTCTVSLPSPAVTGLAASPLSFSITPAVAPGATQAVTISTTVFTPGGTYTIGVSCTGGVGTHTANFSLTVTAAAFNYSVAWNPASTTIAAGASTTPNVVATLTSGQTAAVTCTVSLPSPAVTGLSASPLSFSITPTIAGATQAVTISTTSLTPAGTYTIGVSCTGGVGTHTANFSLTVSAAGFDYTVAWSPTSATIAAGSSTTPNVVATLTSGSASAVTCTVSLPSPAVTGLSASPLSFSITPTTAGAAQAVTISTTVFTPGGTYTIGVSCTGGVGTHTANFTLTVTAAAFDYTVAWNPTSATITAGGSTTPNVVATLTSGTAASVTCTVSVPAVTGLSASPLSFSITPAVAPGATQAVTISTTVFTPGGTYTIGVSCTGGVGTHTANFTLTVTAAAFNYTVAWNPTSATIAAGASTTPNVVATLTSGTAASVTCTVTLPSPAVTGLSASPLSFSITPTIAGATQAVTISTTSLTPAGTYTIGVSCTGGVGTHTANFSLTVSAAGFDYTIAWSPTSATVAAGSSTTPNVVATLTSGTAASVTCTVSLPSPAVTGLSASPLSFSITPTTAGATQAVTISTTVFTPGGTYTIGVSCTGGVGTHTANFSLTVTAAAFNYTVAWSPTSATVAAGGSTTPNVVATLTSGTAVSVTCTVSLPSPSVTGLSASPLSFSITPTIAGATQAVTISTTVFTPAGTYTIGVSCTGGVGTHTANFSLTVTAAAFDYTVAWSPTSATVAAGASTTPNVVATLTSGTAASVTCTVTLPSPAVTGLSASPLSFSITPTIAGATQAVTISTTTLTPAGTYTIGVSCTGGVGTHTANFSLTVSAAGFDYTVAWSPTSATIAAGASTTPNVVATLTSGTAAAVTCTVSLPSPAVTGLSASPLSFSITPTTAGAAQAVTISTTVFTPGGTYTIGVSCTGGVGTHTANFSLTVTAAAFNYSVAWNPTSATVTAGGSTTPNVVATLTSGTAVAVTCTVGLPSPVPTGLSASPLSFSITPTIAGATQAVTISTTSATPAGIYTINVSCTGGVGTHTANFTLTVTAAAFDYTIAWSPTSATVTAGMSTTPNVVATLTSGTAVSVTCTVSVPAVTGLSASPLSFSITPTTAGATQAVMISTTVFTPGGTYTIGVSCTGGVGTHTANFSLTVTAAAFDYTVAWSPTSGTVAAGSSTTPNVVATLTSGQAASVTCTVSVPAVTGLSASPLSFSIMPTTSGATQAVMISTTVFTPGGTYTIGVSCTGGVGSHTANFSLTVTAAAFNYSIAWNPTSGTVAAGGSTTPNVVATLTSGTAVSVTCTVSVPAVTGLSASPLSFSITPTTAGATQAVTIYTTAATPAGTYTIGVSCTGGVGTHTANFTLTVTSGVPLSADFSPTHTIAGTTQFNSTITGGSSPYTCSWSFGDSTPTQAGCNPTHTYANAGTFAVTLNVTDSAGSRATATHSVLVDQAPFFSKNNGFKFFDDTSFTHGQTFRIYVTNPSTFTVTVNVSIDIFDDGGGAFVAHLTGSAVLAPGQSTIISIQWSPPQVSNQYSFVGKVTYSSGSFVTGTIGTKSGFFQITAP